jgi:hypothetical protein
MFVVKNRSYFNKKPQYHQALSELYSHVALYLLSNYNIPPEIVLIDHESNFRDQQPLQ